MSAISASSASTRRARNSDVPGAVHRVVEFYRAQRTSPAEKFIDTLERLGHQPFQDALYAAG